jgi:hypothetical protein
MDKNAVLLMLLKLEQMRLRTEKNPISNMDDYTIRMCQATIAEEYFESRKEWTEVLKAEYGLGKFDIFDTSDMAV